MSAPAQPGQRDLVFYDGQCALCHSAVRFLLRLDSDGRRFAFAPIGGETFLQILGGELAAGLPESVIVRTPDSQTLWRIRALRYLLRRSDFPGRLLGAALHLIPSGIADRAYAAVARRRRRLFGTPVHPCPVPLGRDQDRFLP